jgi:hypothetical protein
MKRSIFSYVAIGATLSACATSSEQLTAASDVLATTRASPEHYRDWSCPQLEAENRRLMWPRHYLARPDITSSDGGIKTIALIAAASTLVLLPIAIHVAQNTPFEDEESAAERSWLIKRFDKVSATIIKVAIQKNCKWSRRCVPAGRFSIRPAMGQASLPDYCRAVLLTDDHSQRGSSRDRL